MSGITHMKYCYIHWIVQMEFERLDIVRDDGDDNAQTKKFVVQKTMDDKSLFWPYPDEQIHWLQKSLDNLDVMTLQAVKVANGQWQTQQNAEWVWLSVQLNWSVYYILLCLIQHLNNFDYSSRNKIVRA